LTHPVQYEHFAYFRDLEAAGRAVPDLRALGCAVVINFAVESVAGHDFILVATRDEDLDGDWVGQHQEVQDVIERHGGTYDGGGTAFT
jgi:hypothetical protein